MTLDKEESVECPLCMESLEIDDLTFFPCVCGYQVCRFCWHRLRTDGNGLCPACRQTYTENPADFTPLSATDIQRLKAEKRQRRTKTSTASGGGSGATGGTGAQAAASGGDSRKHLVDVRVVQRNLVFVVGLPPRLADGDVLRRNEYFGQFGKIRKILVSHPTQQAASQGQCASAHVTYCRPDDALRAIRSVNNAVVDNKTLKVSLGTTKYCSLYLRHQQCSKPDCTFLHEPGDELASFTKEEMQQGRHQEYERRLLDHWGQQQQRKLNKDKLNIDSASTTVSSATSASGGSGTSNCASSRIAQLDCHVTSSAAVVGSASAASSAVATVSRSETSSSAPSNGSAVGKKSRGRRGRRRGHARAVSPHGDDDDGCCGEVESGHDGVRASTPDLCSAESASGSGGDVGASSESDRSSPLSLTEQTVAGVSESAAVSGGVPAAPPTPPPEQHQHQQQQQFVPTNTALPADGFSSVQLVLGQPTPPPDVSDAEMSAVVGATTTTTPTSAASAGSDSVQAGGALSRQQHDTDMTADDDLDFDPFEETAKGLRVLIERERQLMGPVGGVGRCGPGANQVVQPHLTAPALVGGRVRLPPPGFGSASSSSSSSIPPSSVPLSVDPSIVALGVSRRAPVLDEKCCFPGSSSSSLPMAPLSDHYLPATTLPPPLQHVHRLHHHHPHHHQQQEPWQQSELRPDTASSCLFQQRRAPPAVSWTSPHWPPHTQQQQHQPHHHHQQQQQQQRPQSPPHWLRALEQLTETPPPPAPPTAGVPPPGLWSSSVPPPSLAQQQQQTGATRLSEYL